MNLRYALDIIFLPISSNYWWRILDLSYNNIKKIEGLETLKKVEKLFLLSNKIKVIEGLDFPELSMLELGSNKITKIDNLN